MDIQQREETNADTSSQAGDVDEGENLVLPQVSQSGFKVVFEHGRYVLTIINPKIGLQVGILMFIVNFKSLPNTKPSQRIQLNECSKLPSLRGTKQSRTVWDLACRGLLRTSQRRIFDIDSQ